MASDVIVVGGGLVGMTFAATLSRSGINVTVIERADPETLVAAPHDGRASAIAYGSQRLLNAAGLWHGMKDHAEPILDIRVVEGGSPLFLHFNSQALGNKDPADNVLGYMGALCGGGKAAAQLCCTGVDYRYRPRPRPGYGHTG